MDHETTTRSEVERYRLHLFELLVEVLGEVTAIDPGIEKIATIRRTTMERMQHDSTTEIPETAQAFWRIKSWTNSKREIGEFNMTRTEDPTILS